MLGARKERRAARLVPVCLEAAVPADHFYRHLEATLDLGFVREWVADRYAERGRPSIDPVVFFKLQLVMFFEGVLSERHLMRVVADRLSVRWYLGYDLDDPLPDHSSLTRIRERLGLPVFQRDQHRPIQAALLRWTQHTHPLHSTSTTKMLRPCHPLFQHAEALPALFPDCAAC